MLSEKTASKMCKLFHDSSLLTVRQIDSFGIVRNYKEIRMVSLQFLKPLEQLHYGFFILLGQLKGGSPYGNDT